MHPPELAQVARPERPVTTRAPGRQSAGRPPLPARVGAIALLLLACAVAPLTRAQAPAVSAATAASSPAPKIEVIAPADIPSRADADEQFIQAVVQRAQEGDADRRFDETLVRQSAVVKRFAEQTHRIDLSLLSARRLESLHRHWLLYRVELAQVRAIMARTTRASSEDAAGLASRRAVWSATHLAATGLTPALLQRIDELIGQIDRAEKALSVPLAKMFDLGRKATALSAQIDSEVTKVLSQIEEQDRRLLVIDSPPLWQAADSADVSEPMTAGLQKRIEIEMAFARDHDDANKKLLRVLITGCALLLLLMLWLKHRAAHLIFAGAISERSAHALSRPWTAWLVLVSLVAVFFNLQGPVIRQQAVMVLAWAPVLRLLPPRILAALGPWSYLSVVFFLMNAVASLLVDNQIWYRWLLLAIDIFMLLAVAWMIVRARRGAEAGAQPAYGRVLPPVLMLAAAGLFVAAASNVLGNVSLATMLTGAMLDSGYTALAMYAGATVLLALFQVLLARPTVSRITARDAGSFMRAGTNVARTVLGMAWLVIALHVFRIYRPLKEFLVSILTHDFTLGVVTISLGSIAVFLAAAWLAYWLAKTIRDVLAEDIMPTLSLPRGVGNTISTLTYYTILFLGLLTALAVAGFHVGQLTIVFGALAVGIGFGLQDIVKNFVSSLIIMFERPIRPGDIVDIAGTSGVVRDIGMRATTVTTAEGAEVVVPNGMLLADKFVNWTRRHSGRRIDINVITSYGAAPQRTIELLTRIAATIEGIALTPPPAMILTGLATGALEFNLRAWTTEHADYVTVRSALAVKIRDGLAGAGIEVPLPQRELNLRVMSREAAEELGVKKPGQA